METIFRGRPSKNVRQFIVSRDGLVVRTDPTRFIFVMHPLYTSVFKMHEDSIMTMTFSPDEKWIASVDRQRNLFVWSVETLQVRQHLFVVSEYSPALWLNNDQLLVTLMTNKVAIFDLNTTSLHVQFESKINDRCGQSEDLTQVAWCEHSILYVFDTVTATLLHFDRTTAPFDFLLVPRTVRFLDKDHLLLLSDETASIWNKTTGLVRSFPVKNINRGKYLEVSKDQSCLIGFNSFQQQQFLSIYDIASGKMIFHERLGFYRDVWKDPVFSYDGKKIYLKMGASIVAMKTPDTALLEMQQKI